MLNLLLLALVGSAAAIPLAEVDRAETNEQLALRYNLPRESIPTHYDVTLYLNPDYTDNFNGSVSIRLTPSFITSQIVLHAMEMTINSISLFSDRDLNVDLFDNFTLATDDTHLLRIYTNQELQTDVFYVLNIDYTGQYADNMFGIYVSTYTNEDGGPS